MRKVTRARVGAIVGKPCRCGGQRVCRDADGGQFRRMHYGRASRHEGGHRHSENKGLRARGVSPNGQRSDVDNVGRADQHGVLGSPAYRDGDRWNHGLLGRQRKRSFGTRLWVLSLARWTDATTPGKRDGQSRLKGVAAGGSLLPGLASLQSRRPLARRPAYRAARSARWRRQHHDEKCDTSPSQTLRPTLDQLPE